MITCRSMSDKSIIKVVIFISGNFIPDSAEARRAELERKKALVGALFNYCVSSRIPLV